MLKKKTQIIMDSTFGRLPKQELPTNYQKLYVKRKAVKNIMTKTYIKPETITVKVELQQMIADSPNTPVQNNDATQDGNNDYEDARAFGFFFEEREEEF